MEKYCPKCGKVYKGKEARAKVCMYCAIPLKERESRIPFSEDIRDKVFKRDGYRCVRCGASNKEKRLEVDHIIPISRGGTNDIGNLQTLCWECNKDKGPIVPDLGLKYDIEIKKNELKTLTRLLKENKNKLNTATNENDRIEYAFNIKQLEKDISSVSKELNEFKIKFEEEQERIKIENEENERKEFLFKKLSVKLSPIEILILKEHFDLSNLTNEAMLKTISNEYTEDMIFQAIENYKTDLHQTLDNSITFNMLPLISSELSLSTNSKETIITYLINNYTKTQINDLIDKVKSELFNQYAASFNNLEKSILKKHYSLNNISDAKLINYVIENDYSIDELKNTIKLAYKSIFQEYYNQLDEYQQYLVIVRFENHGNNLVDFLAINNFSTEKLLDELNKTKLELFDKTYKSLNYNKKSLIDRYSNKHTGQFDLMDYFYKNKFDLSKIDELVDLSKKELLNDIPQNLNDHEMFLLDNTFETDYHLLIFMIEHEYSIKSLMKKLKRTEKNMISNLEKDLTDKQKFLIKKYFQINNNINISEYLVNHDYNYDKSVKLVNNFKKELYNKFEANINYDYENILYDKFSLKTNSKDELINYLIFENYSVRSMKQLIRDDVYSNFDKLFDIYSISQVCYKLNLHPDKGTLYKYLFDEKYTIYSSKQLIKQAKMDLSKKLTEKLDFRTVELLTRQLDLPNSKSNLISYLMQKFTVNSIIGLLKKYDIEFE